MAELREPDVSVLDTMVLVDYLRDDARAVMFLDGMTSAPFCSEITRTEVVRGLRSAERVDAQRLLDGLRWVPVNESISQRAGELGRQYRRSHQGVGVADLIVAATAMALGADLATANVRHYPMFKGLRPPY